MSIGGRYEYSDETRLEDYRRDGYMSRKSRRSGEKKEIPFKLNYDNSFPNSLHCNDIHKRWKILLAARHPLGTDIHDDKEEVGKELHPYAITEDGGFEDMEDSEVSLNDILIAS